jgi:phosphohistidine phosphatase SixA
VDRPRRWSPEVLLMRHASAGERLGSAAEDLARRLDAPGRSDARRLPAALAAHAIERIVSSPHARCLESVAPLARRRGLTVESREELAPGARLKATLALLSELPESTLVCTHREVLERLFGGEVTCAKGGTWIVEWVDARPLPVAYVPPSSSAVPSRKRAATAVAARRRAPGPARRSRP